MGKRIVIIGPAHPYRGGIAAFNERLARELIKQGDEVTIYTFTVQYPSVLFPGKTQYTDQPKPSDLKIMRKINAINPLNWMYIGNQLKKFTPDILIIRYWLPLMAPCFGTLLRMVKKNKYTKIIAITDNIVPHEKRPGDTLLSKYFMPPVDAFLALSKSVLRDLTQLTNKPSYFSPHPLYDTYGEIISKSQAKKNLKLSDEHNYILFFGFIREYKGLDILIKAFGDHRLRKFPLKLIVAGEFYVDPEPYHKLIDESGCSEDIILHNQYISDSAVADYFNAADLIAQPYKSATQSGVTQIAFHFNKPVLVTDVGGLPEIIPDKKVGYLVKPDPEHVADALVDFYDNQREQDFIPFIKEHKKQYSWEKLTSYIKDIYNTL